jgi:hypothetical protein
MDIHFFASQPRLAALARSRSNASSGPWSDRARRATSCATWGDSIYTFFPVHGEKLLKAHFLEKIGA